MARYSKRYCKHCGFTECDSLLPKTHPDYNRCPEEGYKGPRCSDCGQKGVTVGHQECQYPQDH